jgi:tRNA(fMet)-specific endonuclease VapC
MKYLLDTDVLTHLHAGHPRVHQHVLELAETDIGTTIITKIEILRGRFDAVLKAATGPEIRRAQDWLIETEDSLAEIEIVPFDAKAAAHFDRLRKDLKKMRRADLLIASIALARQAVLVTRNMRHFRAVPNLKVTNWVD